MLNSKDIFMSSYLDIFIHGLGKIMFVYEMKCNIMLDESCNVTIFYHCCTVSRHLHHTSCWRFNKGKEIKNFKRFFLILKMKKKFVK